MAQNEIRLNQLDDAGATNGQVMTFDGTRWTPTNPSGGGGSSSAPSLELDTSDINAGNAEPFSLDASTGEVTWSGTPLTPTAGAYFVQMHLTASADLGYTSEDAKGKFLVVGGIGTPINSFQASPSYSPGNFDVDGSSFSTFVTDGSQSVTPVVVLSTGVMTGTAGINLIKLVSI